MSCAGYRYGLTMPGGLRWTFLIAAFICLPFIGSESTESLEVDRNGYIMYCPCMGRFGNQADHFLGVLGFAKALNRTLVLPAWIEYRPGQRGSQTVPFRAYFDPEKVNEYHRAITMERFFADLSETVWPVGQRISLCYTARHGQLKESCNAKDGNPFGPFWDAYNVSFDRSEMYGPLSSDLHHQGAAELWNKRFPADQYPVLAFTGAPASFPVQVDNLPLQRYLLHNQGWQDRAQTWIRDNLPREPFVGIHLRNGVDWSRACEHVTSSTQLFSSPQCLGYRNEHGSLYKELCFPSEDTIIKHVKKAIKKVAAKAVFVASDDNHMISWLENKLKKMEVSVHRQNDLQDPHLDLVILSKSNFFIGNCISSFSAFVKRTRDVDGLPSGFWGYPKPRKPHDEF